MRVSYGTARRARVAEYYALLAAAGGGMMFIVAAENLMTLFLGLEWFSITLYVLCALDLDRKESLEAGLKYLIVGSFGSAVLLFGSALVYGSTGSSGSARSASATGAGDALLRGRAGHDHRRARVQVIRGAVPHVDAGRVPGRPHTGHGLHVGRHEDRRAGRHAPRPHHRVPGARPDVDDRDRGDRLHLARGRQPRRARADEREAPARVLVDLAGRVHAHPDRGGHELGGRALLFYLLVYSAMSIGAFAVVAARERELGREVTVDDLDGMGWERPFHGVAMLVFMLGFAGFPLTGGILAKFYAFSAAYEAGWWWLVVIGVAATAISLYYYLSVIRAMFMRPAWSSADSRPRAAPRRVDSCSRDCELGALVVTIGSFFFVQPVIDWRAGSDRVAAVLIRGSGRYPPRCGRAGSVDLARTGRLRSQHGVPRRSH